MKEYDLNNSIAFRSNGRTYISGRPWIRISENAGANWRRVELDTKELSFIMNYNSSAFAELPTGVKLLAVYGRRAEGKKTEPFILISVNGKDWSIYAMFEANVLDEVAGINETALLALGGKRVLAVGRGEPDGVGLYFSISEDEGASWSKPRPLDIPGYPANLVDSPMGIILTYGYRKPPMGIRVSVLDRESFEVRSSHTLTKDAVGRPSDVGYPVTLMVGFPNFITAFYTTGSDGVTHIETLKWRFDN
ncbi:sialidase family protein [Cupriavidus sp. AcVe19-6a]|uniref:sialidase family protein n=1 Tax=Cupriavidus sp. AcVe19-6a TaxID=2821358 RepID=UPI001AE4EB21|nr:sialidase family protein [Cupriavidus sp. AcVe19-6a]MBP0640057.1 exo-alpha-sialidase [Cupriavidus sp. AcVe19-6a]